MQYPGQRIQIDVKVVPRSCIANPELRLCQYTAIDEYSRYRILGAHFGTKHVFLGGFPAQGCRRLCRKGVKVECVQNHNGLEFTNRFSSNRRDKTHLFEAAAAELGIRHKLIRPYMRRHNGKVERSHREDQKCFYDSHCFYSIADFDGQLTAHQSRSNSRSMRPLAWQSPRQLLSSFHVQYV